MIAVVHGEETAQAVGFALFGFFYMLVLFWCWDCDLGDKGKNGNDDS